MVYRIFVEKKHQFQNESNLLLKEINQLLNIKSLTQIRIVNRYDVENIPNDIFEKAKNGIFAEPQLDNIIEKDKLTADYIFGVEALSGQFDQRADSCATCLQILSQNEKPLVKYAKIFLLYGKLTEKKVDKIKDYLINPVECCLASMEKYSTLQTTFSQTSNIKNCNFVKLNSNELIKFAQENSLAMDIEDLKFCQNYFKSENREPTITEIKILDTYWSDHCRHTTFSTIIQNVKFKDKIFDDAYKLYLDSRRKLGRNDKPQTLMDIATIGAKILKKEGYLKELDESEEINACSINIQVEIDGKMQDWLLLFKNETHNHPTEIEPFGGAATCIGGAIRDPLSGRAYVYSAMRISGAGNPLQPIENTIYGKLPQRKIVQTASSGYSSYGNQIGLATGMVDEIYHDGYIAKHMEVGAVIGAVPKQNVRREEPKFGDVVILIGGKTGRDGCGGATGSSKSHSQNSINECGSQVQKGNAPEERKLQRLFRNKQASLLVKRCNDFGAGGVSVAIGELADGIEIDLNKVPKKYNGLDGTELAISESQERMAVVVSQDDAEKYINFAHEENLQATIVAKIIKDKRLKMFWNGNLICDLSREFLSTNGAKKYIDIELESPKNYQKDIPVNFENGIVELVQKLNICSKKGLIEKFDSTIGAGTVLMPLGGKTQNTPIQAMANKIVANTNSTETCSLMSWGYNPFIAEKSAYHSAYLAVVESVSKLISTGASFKSVYLTFQEYFEKLNKDAKRWGKPMSALLGALKAQYDLKIAAIGGKDSMSGSFDNIDVPPTLISFAVTTEKTQNIISPEFKKLIVMYTFSSLNMTKIICQNLKA